MTPKFTIVRHDSAAGRLKSEPIPGRWYFGVHADGSTGALAQWDGWRFVSSQSDDHDMTVYAYLQEQPPRG